MKKLLAILLAMTMVMALVACGGNNDSTPPAGDTKQEEAPPADSAEVLTYIRQKALCDQQKADLEEAKEQLKRLEFGLSTHMIGREEALCGDVKMRWTQRKSRSVDMDGLALAYPDIYARFVREKVTPGFEVRLKKSAQTKEAKEAA